MHPLIARLVAAAPVVTDGAWGTQLQARGLPLGGCADAWNLTHPEVVAEVARAYAAAGSQVLLTNTFRANRWALAAHGLASRLGEINRAGVALAREAAASRALVFGSLGPSGEPYAPGLRALFAEQAEALADAGADALVLETFTDLKEALVALAAARATGLPVVASMTFDTDKEQGLMPEHAAATLTAAGADVIGANCGAGIAGFVAVCTRLRAGTDRPLWIKPNAGLPRIIAGQALYATTSREFASYGPALRDAGATFLGGCCGTTPDFIRALREALGCG